MRGANGGAARAVAQIGLIAILVVQCALGHSQPSADGFAWLEGQWCLRDGAQTVEETWLPSHGGVQLGVSRTLEGESTTAFEFMRIERRDGAVYFVPQPGGAPPVSFRLVDSGPTWARFENRQHDFPQVIEYRREGRALTAIISGPGERGESLVRFGYTRCARMAR